MDSQTDRWQYDANSQSDRQKISFAGMKMCEHKSCHWIKCWYFEKKKECSFFLENTKDYGAEKYTTSYTCTNDQNLLLVSLKLPRRDSQQVVVMEFGKRHDTTDTTDFCPCQLVTDLLQQNWCNRGFSPNMQISYFRWAKNVNSCHVSI